MGASTIALRLAFLVVPLVGYTGCTMGSAGFPLVAFDGSAMGFKMLSPRIEARACGVGIWPSRQRRSARRVQELLAQLHRRNPEATVVRDAVVSWHGVDLLLFDVGCLRLRGDLGRTVPTVALPMFGEGGHHGTHDHGTSGLTAPSNGVDQEAQ